MRATCLVALLVLGVCQASARETPRANEEKPDPKSWAGTYVYSESGMNVTGTRSFGRNYCIDVVEKGGALSAVKYEFASGDIPDKAEFWDARAADADGKIEFTYKGCSIPGEKACEDEVRPGTEMLALVRVQTKKSVAYKPVWRNLQPFDMEKPRKVDFVRENVVCSEGGALKE